MHRTQILFEPDQHAALAEAAQRENYSISDLVWEIVRYWLAIQDDTAKRQRELEILEQLTKLRLRILEQHGVYQGNLIEEIRLESRLHLRDRVGYPGGVDRALRAETG